MTRGRAPNWYLPSSNPAQHHLLELCSARNQTVQSFRMKLRTDLGCPLRRITF
jgi:hypothetical protein